MRRLIFRTEHQLSILSFLPTFFTWQIMKTTATNRQEFIVKLFVNTPVAYGSGGFCIPSEFIEFYFWPPCEKFVLIEENFDYKIDPCFKFYLKRDILQLLLLVALFLLI